MSSRKLSRDLLEGAGEKVGLDWQGQMGLGGRLAWARSATTDRRPNKWSLSFRSYCHSRFPSLVSEGERCV